MQKKGKLFVISAPSGSGKTTLEKMLLDSNLELTKSVSVTTRKPREDEKEARDYYFISQDEFLKRRKGGKFLEWAKVFNHYYATPKEKVDKFLEEEKNIILSIDVQGARQIKDIYHDAVFIFVKSPSIKDLETRLIKRKSDKPQDIKKRLEVAKEELLQSKMYDYIVINDDVKKAYKDLKKIIENKIKEC